MEYGKKESNDLKVGKLSQKLRGALGMTTDDNSPLPCRAWFTFFRSYHM